MKYSAGSCSVTGCSRPVRTLGFCYGHYERVRRFDDPMADIPLSVANNFSRNRFQHGPFYCTCEIARPAGLGVCVTCGYKVVAMMSPRVRDPWFADFPWFADQPVEEARSA